MNVPNVLTLVRIGLVPVFFVVFFLPVAWANEVCTALFGLAAVTDGLDGWLARRLGQSSRFGAFLDPVADKLMVAVALVALVARDPGGWLAAPAAIIIGREIAVSALREWMAEVGERARVAVSIIGKLKTIAQMVALVLLLYGEPVGQFPTWIVGVIFLYLAAALTLWSMAVYLRAAWPALSAPGAGRGAGSP
ncbi:CDP-diacylglycerol--glycerol-3-phosphate 3-phosphatidyltransferase [Inmirania thermothiophila]|uniref:CDP-diacylglycerol--glycerol-3-phosphate 3-phosphatidyltransferase n=1 Tax=Inmirania thermothiophila TaxID=1750597 RepID=A0A3N1Y007_9GAMM|nr:CDP-diacylglycerol--glycerol-3-phosphate 3-phosphatidyltransferase [Inmirania thermothiophila]ROR32185.1 CDP-diacylglycerol--glycerol-3-phosphate 3-phosphatidyltransferase/cardiolipin synthase [Inmirania thermothiophila]